jgi:NTP pyrophosphatase (non-canonical NTP hydrolase)
MDNMGMKWETEFGDCVVTAQSIDWIMKNAKTSMYNDERSYVYNKAFARWFENNDAFNLDNAAQMNLMDQYNGRTIAGALSPISNNLSQFDLIREWANERGLYKGGDSKTQALKLVEEVGETCKAILKSDEPEIIDGIGDCVVVLTNLAELIGTPIEDCIAAAYNEIKGRTGKMDNGTFKKD